MADPIYLNLHTHTLLSDGALTPEALAEKLAGAGVRYAALADHDTVEGWPRFRDVLDAHGIPSLPGIELTTRFEGRLLHLIAYGFDPDHPELTATLASMREHRSVDTHSIVGSLRAASAQPPAADAGAASSAPDGELEVAAAMAMLHRAGGRAFLAHPLVYERDIDQLERLVVELKARGLDGIEAIYAEFSVDEREALCRLAREHDLLVSAGTDYHGVAGLGSRALGIAMPDEDWTRFRAAVLHGPGLSTEARPVAGATNVGSTPVGDPPGSSHRFRRRSFVLRIVLPAVAAMVLVLVALWGVLLPSFEGTLVERKREMIRELTNSAWSVLAAYQADERAGTLTREEAQAAAADVVRELRYGEEGLDYFWIQDTGPTMVMHPYRPDLDGEDLSDLIDPRGVPIFVEFAELVEAEDEGYADYVWQWFDDPDRLEPKESYVKGFEPWGWVIGTGLYTDDVRAEIDRIARDLILAALGISGLFALLLFFVLQQSLRIERRREESVDRLRDSNARYHALIEATTEGTLLVIDGRLRYANPTFLKLLGYTSRQLEFLKLDDVLPRGLGNDELWAALGSAPSEAQALGVAREGVLTRSDGSALECVLTLEPVEFGGQAGNILLARDVTTSTSTPADTSALGSSVGIFRAVAARRAVFVDLSPAGRELLTPVGRDEDQQLSLADCFADAADFGRVYRRLIDHGEVRDQIITIDTPAGERSVLLSAVLVRDDEDEPAWIDGLLVDVTSARDEAAGREVRQLRASLLFLHESVGGLGQDAIVTAMDTSLHDLATLMTERAATAALVESASGSVIGIVTDHDIRARVVAERKAASVPVEAVMSAPLIRVPAGAPVYEALLRMEQHGVRHLAVEDPAGAIVGVIDKDSLVGTPRYAPLVMLREMARASSADEVARRCERTVPVAASLMDSSARPRHVNGTLTSIFDAATARLIELAFEEVGPAPAPFAFIAFGSQGRSEVHLIPDQDNGLIYALPDEADTDVLETYFLRLGSWVAAGLNGAGYPFCRGQIMASEAEWCRSLPDWIETYDTWLRQGEPQDITDLSVFLDFRPVYGEAGLARQLRRHVHETLPEQRGVQYLLARNALTFRPPLRLPGNIYLGGAAEQSGRIDLKDALQPIVAFARVDAERHRVTQTHTLDRIVALAERDLLPAGSREQITDAYDFLMELRLETQMAGIREGRTPTSVVELAKLTHTQQELLRAAYTEIASVQKTAENEFPEVG